MAVAKVVVNGNAIVDMTDATATADKILSPYTAYGADGEKITGTASGGGGDEAFHIVYSFSSITGPVTFSENYADIKGAVLVGEDIILDPATLVYGSMAACVLGYVTNTTFGTKTFTEGICFRLEVPASNGVVYDVMYGYSNNVLTQELVLYADPPASGTINITKNGTTDISEYAYANVQVSSSGTEYIVNVAFDGDEFSTDKTWSQIQTAYNAGKTIAVSASPASDITADGAWDATNNRFDYWVRLYSAGTPQKMTELEYYLTSTGLTRNEYVQYLKPTGTYTVDSAGTKDVTNYQYASIQSGSAGTPTATKGTVSNHQVSITPSVTNSTGWITGSTKNGTAITVTASELASGNKEITSSGTGIDVVGYSTVSVASGSVTAPVSISGSSATVSTGTNTLTLTKDISVTPNITTAGYISSGTAGTSSVSLTASVNTRSSSDLSASGATVTAPAGYYASSASKSVASGSATGPSSLSASSATVSTGTNTLTLTKTGVSTTPTVSAGYVSSATASTATVALTASVTTKAAATIHPSSSSQSIASGTYLTGAQTIAAVTTTNLTASNILSGVTVKVGDSSDDDCVASVTGNVTFQTYYTGSSAPSSALGVDGDIYLQTGS